MKEIIEMFGEIDLRTVENIETGERWVNALDVAKVLGYKNPSVQIQNTIKRNPELYEGTTKLVVASKGGKQESTFFNLDHVIAFCMKSNRPKALPFQKWAVKILKGELTEEAKKKIEKQEIRLKSKTARNYFTSVLSNRGIEKKHEFIQLTYAVKVNVGIDKNKKKDDFDIKDLLLVTMAEANSTLNMLEENPEGYGEIKPVVERSSRQVKECREIK